MKRGQSTDMRIRKQQAFKPIMLSNIPIINSFEEYETC